MSGVRCWIAAALVIATCCTASVSARATEPCAQVVSYFMYPDQGSALKQHEWRIYDPSHGGDALFLANSRGFDELRWDTTFSTAWYRSGLTLYSIAWRRGATPKPICTLPEIKSPVDWWFNPDSACWQYGSAVMFDSSGARLHFACELWQSSRDFRHWRRIRSDTLECESGECDEWSWTEGEWARHAPTVTLEDLDAATWAGTWGDRARPFDTAAVRVLDFTLGNRTRWHFISTGASGHRGIAFQMEVSNDWVVTEPYLFVDLDLKTRHRIESGREATWSKSFLAKRCGLLLMPGANGNPLIVDAETGRVVLSQSRNSKAEVWVQAPRPRRALSPPRLPPRLSRRAPSQ